MRKYMQQHVIVNAVFINVMRYQSKSLKSARHHPAAFTANVGGIHLNETTSSICNDDDNKLRIRPLRTVINAPEQSHIALNKLHRNDQNYDVIQHNNKPLYGGFSH